LLFSSRFGKEHHLALKQDIILCFSKRLPVPLFDLRFPGENRGSQVVDHKPKECYDFSAKGDFRETKNTTDSKSIASTCFLACHINCMIKRIHPVHSNKI
jgi:hypothetical protein